jgi:hypothetical protein
MVVLDHIRGEDGLALPAVPPRRYTAEEIAELLVA